MQRLLRSVAVSVVAAGFTALAVYLGAHLLYPVTGIRVEGARMFPESEAWEALPDRASLLTLDTDDLEGKIRANPWVEGAKVSKNWESGIVTVEVEERRAVLSAVLDGRETAFAADGTELPGLGGAHLERIVLDEGRLQGILGIGEVLEQNGVSLNSVDAVGPGGVTATVEDRRMLFAGEIGEKQARALEDLVRRHPDAPYFDLRSPGRVVVGATELERGEEDRSEGFVG